MAKAITSAFLSLAGSSLTTVAGFAALCFMGFTIGMDLGIVMMKGVVLGVLTCVTFLPALILIFDESIHKYTHKTLIPDVEKLTDFILKHRNIAILIFLISFIPSYYFQSNIRIYYDISSSLPKTIESNIGKEKLKNDFKMSTSHIIVMRDDIKEYEMRDMTNKLEKIDGIKSVLSYSNLVGPGIPDSFVPKQLFK